MRPPRISIRVLLLGVALFAVECATWRAIGGTGSLPIGLGLGGTWVMVHLLAYLGCRASARGTFREPFSLGFAVAGTLAVLAWLNFCLMVDERWLVIYTPRAGQIVEWMPHVGVMLNRRSYEAWEMLYFATVLILFCALCAALAALPQILVALSVGYLARRIVARWRSANPERPHARGSADFVSPLSS